MAPPPPSRAFLAAQVRWAMGRGLPAEVAEDVVFESWERAAARFDPSRGSFEAFMQRVVRSACAQWWRRQAREARARHRLEPVQVLPSGRPERAEALQEALLDALTEEERRVFAAWALQRHLGKGRVRAAQVGASIGLGPREFENAKRRLKDRIRHLVDRFGWSVHDLIHGEADVDRAG